MIVPTCDNAGTVADVVERTLRYCGDVIVVNDGSADATRQILAAIPEIVVINSPKNEGKGAALRRGFRKALDLGFAYAITLDADGQHYPEDIPRFLEANMEHPGCLIVGARNLDGVQRSKGSAFANAFSNFWFCVQTFHRLPDTQTGYRLYPLKKLKGLSLLTSRYEAELELMVFASWHGVRLVSVPVDVWYPKPEERVSHFRPALDFARISVLNTALCVLAVVYGLPWFLYRTVRTLSFTVAYHMVYLVGGVMIVLAALTKRLYSPAAKRPVNVLHRAVSAYGRFVVKALNFFGATVNVENPCGEDFKNPSVIICNHQSQLDLMLQLSQAANIVFLTSDRVWRNPIVGPIVRCAGYCPVSMGLDELLPRLRLAADRGFSIALFPEGTRSANGKIGRFHKGAFYIASKLNLDMLPLTLYGTGRVMPKHGWIARNWPICLSVGKRISHADMAHHGADFRTQAKNMRKQYQTFYDNLKNRMERDV